MKFKLNAQYSYILATLFNSAVGFIKSYLFMDVLVKRELGYLALFQSLIIVVSFFQLGTITGAYRLVSFSKERRYTANNTVTLFLLCLAFLFICSLVITLTLGLFNTLLLAGGFVGLVSLWMNWLTNLHIALGRTKLLSRLILVSIIISLFGLPLLYRDGIWGAILVLGLQPVSFVILTFIFNRDFKFKIRSTNRKYLKLLWRYGFIPFLTSILYYVNQQLERWIIGFDLGLERLGEYYLVFVYTSLFLVIPTALGTVNFPNMVKKIRNEGKKYTFFQVFGRYYLELCAYGVLMGVFTFFVFPPLIEAFLPVHKPGLTFVRLIFFGLLAFSLIDPISFIVNAQLHFKELISIYIVALVISSSSYGYILLAEMGSLYNYAMVNLIFFGSVSAGYFVYYILKGNKSFSNEKLV